MSLLPGRVGTALWISGDVRSFLFPLVAAKRFWLMLRSLNLEQAGDSLYIAQMMALRWMDILPPGLFKVILPCKP